MKISEIDLSDDISKIALISILILYVGLSLNELFVDECTGLGECAIHDQVWSDDFDRRMAKLHVWNIDWIFQDFRHSIHLGLLVLSFELFHNYKILVMASSVLLLIVTYAFTLKIAEKNIAGIVAVLVLLQSSIFHNYDTSVTYPPFWALLFVASLYLSTVKKWWIFPVPFFIAIPAKAITGLFIPAVLAFEWFYNRKAFKVFLILCTSLIIIFLVFNQFANRSLGGFYVIDDFRLQNFLGGFVSWMWQGFGSDQITLLLFIIFGFLLFFNRKQIKNSSAILALILGMVLTSPILNGLTTYSVWPYRELPFVVVISLTVGLVIANIDKINLKMFVPTKSIK